jgi:ribosomal protein L14
MARYVLDVAGRSVELIVQKFWTTVWPNWPVKLSVSASYRKARSSALSSELYVAAAGEQRPQTGVRLSRRVAACHQTLARPCAAVIREDGYPIRLLDDDAWGIVFQEQLEPLGIHVAQVAAAEVRRSAFSP